MKTINVPGCDREVSVIGIGCMRIAEMAWQEADSFLRAALDAGVNFVDEADIYGGGKSEEVIGSVLQKDPSLRERIFLQSKCAIHDGMFDFSKEYILKSVDAILSRLCTDHLDSLLLHRPDALMEPEEVAEAFDELQRSGKVLAFGVSNQNPMQMEYLQASLKQKLWTDQVQLSCAHTVMLDAGFNADMHNDAGIMRDGGILPYCQLRGMAVQAWSPLQMGYFEGVFLGNEKYAELNEVLSEIAAAYGVTPDVIAYAWILRIPAKMQVVLGTTKSNRVASAAAAAEIRLTRKQWYDIYCAAGNRLP